MFANLDLKHLYLFSNGIHTVSISSDCQNLTLLKEVTAITVRKHFNKISERSNSAFNRFRKCFGIIYLTKVDLYPRNPVTMVLSKSDCLCGNKTGHIGDGDL